MNDFGAFDVGIALGTNGTDAIQSTSFVLEHDTAFLTLDSINLADFGLRVSGEKVGDQASAAITATDDAFMLDEGTVGAAANVLTNDSATTGLVVTEAVDDMGNPLSLTGANNVTTDGNRSGILTFSPTIPTWTPATIPRPSRWT